MKREKWFGETFWRMLILLFFWLVSGLMLLTLLIIWVSVSLNQPRLQTFGVLFFIFFLIGGLMIIFMSKRIRKLPRKRRRRK